MMKQKIWKNLELKTAAILLVLVALLSISLYTITYNQYYRLILSNLQDNAVVVHQYTEQVIEPETFENLNTRQDEQEHLYTHAHDHLNEIRHIANILYLYTAKRSESGELVYLVDGLEKDNEDFRHVGDPIEDEIIAQLEQSLGGEIVFGDRIQNTDWGIVYVAYFPFHDESGDVIGAIGMEFDCENLYNATNRARIITIIVSIAISAAFIAIAYVIIHRVVNRAEEAFSDVEQKKTDTEEMMRAIMNASPLACHYWSRDLKILDCNDAALKLFGYKNIKDYCNKWLIECNPEYQPDGQKSHVLGPALAAKAFEEGGYAFNWMHKLSDGSLMPAEVSFVRIKSSENDYFLIGYTRDLRKERALEAQAGDSYRDALTGVYTKQYLDSRLSRLIRILSRATGELSMIMVSIDYLKPYYEAYGPVAGERCLKVVAQMLSNVARRADDFVVRYRDDEFVIVLPNTQKVNAQRIADELIEMMHELNLPHKNNTAAPHVTLSIGVTNAKVLHRQRVSDYVNRVEEMLYISKHEGRNRSSYADL